MINHLAKEKWEHQLISETVAFAESGVCRRKILLSYFGEEYENEKCGNCDNCLHPKEKIEAKDEVVCALKAIKALDERFAMEYVVNMIYWKANATNNHVSP